MSLHLAGGSESRGTGAASPALMAATDKGALRSAQISKKYLVGARTSVIGAEGFACVTDKGDVEIVGSAVP